MGSPETNRAKIVKRLAREGWVSRDGGSHEVYTHPNRPGVAIALPRHRTISVGVAYKIVKLAGWV